MKLRNMLKLCLVFWKSEPQYAYKRYAYKKTCIMTRGKIDNPNSFKSLHANKLKMEKHEH